MGVLTRASVDQMFGAVFGAGNQRIKTYARLVGSTPTNRRAVLVVRFWRLRSARYVTVVIHEPWRSSRVPVEFGPVQSWISGSRTSAVHPLKWAVSHGGTVEAIEVEDEGGTMLARVDMDCGPRTTSPGDVVNVDSFSITLD